MPNKSYVKGYRFEAAVKAVLGLLGECTRAFMSGAYTGACDLKWLWQNRFWGVSCKIKKDGYKTIYDELEKDDTDLIVFRSDRKPAIIALYLHDLPEFLGEEHEASQYLPNGTEG
jgi:hypothetical protein